MKLNELFDNTVFLLGAGASMEADCLMSSKMLDSLSKKINEIPADFKPYCEYKDGFKDLYKIVKSSLSYQAAYKGISVDDELFYTPNIEDFILILRKILNKDYLIPEPLVGSWSEKLLILELKYSQKGNIFQSFLDFIYYCVIKWLTPASYDKANELLEPVKKLLEETTDEEYYINFFTLNYDLVFEKVFNSSDSRPLNNGFSNNIWDATSFDIQNAKINLFKIHGSLDWYKKEDETLSMPDHNTAFNDLDPTEISPHLILGYENKLFSVDPFFSLLQEFIKKLDKAKLVVIIGYSFFDAYLNNILIKFLNSTDSKKLLIVDPKFSKIENGNEAFTNYLKLIQSDASTLNIDNYKTLPSSKITFYQADKDEIWGAKKFYSDFFSNKCQKLQEIYSELAKEDEPFS